MRSFKDMAIRAVNAENAFIEYIMETHEKTKTEAQKVLRVFLKAKVLKIDSLTGQWSVKHGVYLEPDVIQNAINQ